MKVSPMGIALLLSMIPSFGVRVISGMMSFQQNLNQ